MYFVVFVVVVVVCRSQCMWISIDVYFVRVLVFFDFVTCRDVSVDTIECSKTMRVFISVF